MIRSVVSVASCALVAFATIQGCSAAQSAKGECVGDTAAELKVCATGTTLKGLDVSSYEGAIAWPAVKASGNDFAFIRVSDGLNSVDSKFAANWYGAKSAGVVRGVYQYFRPGQDPTAQANLLVSRLAANGGYQSGDLPPVLDLESDGGLAPATVVANAKTWIAVVEAALGIKPIVYTAAFMSNVIGSNFAGYALWVANYQTTCPTMPSGWSTWRFWQSSENGTVPGVPTTTDIDTFQGTLAELNAMTLSGAAIPVPDPPARPSSETPAADPQGSVLGSSANPSNDAAPPNAETTAARITPCQ